MWLLLPAPSCLGDVQPAGTVGEGAAEGTEADRSSDHDDWMRRGHVPQCGPGGAAVSGVSVLGWCLLLEVPETCKASREHTDIQP